MLTMKTKTIWYTLLIIILFSSMIMIYYNLIGLLLFGVSCYTAGAYQVKWQLEKNDKEYDKLLENDKNK